MLFVNYRWETDRRVGAAAKGEDILNATSRRSRQGIISYSLLGNMAEGVAFLILEGWFRYNPFSETNKSLRLCRLIDLMPLTGHFNLFRILQLVPMDKIHF